MFEGYTAAKIEKRVADMLAEKDRLLGDLRKLRDEHKRIRAEIDNKTRVYNQYMVGRTSLRKAPVISMKDYESVRDTINDIVTDFETKGQEETRIKDEIERNRQRILDIDTAVAGAQEASGKACRIYYGHFGVSSGPPPERP